MPFSLFAKHFFPVIARRRWVIKYQGRSDSDTYINFGGLGKSPNWVNVVVEDDDSHHHPHAEEHGVCVGETAAVLPAAEV